MEKLFGIDISHWQGDMSIEQARNERGVRFAIIKAAGADDGKYKDSKFENYYAQCKAIGLPVGAYYYGNAKSVAEAEQEADHFLSVIAGKQFEYPIYYDVEGKMLNNSRDVLTDIVIAFCDKCEKAGYFVGVYTSDSHFQAHVDDDRLQRFTHWVARYAGYIAALRKDAKITMMKMSQIAGCSPAEYSSYEHERKEFDPEIYRKCEKYLKEKEGGGRC